MKAIQSLRLRLLRWLRSRRRTWRASASRIFPKFRRDRRAPEVPRVDGRADRAPRETWYQARQRQRGYDLSNCRRDDW
jgi:hypothetical protein